MTAAPPVVTDATGAAGATGWGRHTRVRGVGWTAVAAAVVGLPAVAGSYTVSVAGTALVLVVLAMSTQLLVGVAGLPAFGQAAYLGVGAYTAAVVAGAGVATGPVQLAAAAAAGAVAAAVTAPLVLRSPCRAWPRPWPRTGPRSPAGTKADTPRRSPSGLAPRR